MWKYDIVFGTAILRRGMTFNNELMVGRNLVIGGHMYVVTAIIEGQAYVRLVL